MTLSTVPMCMTRITSGNFANEGHDLGKIERKELNVNFIKVNVNILEESVFMFLWLLFFAFGELKLMEGSIKIIFIARDENQHLQSLRTF